MVSTGAHRLREIAASNGTVGQHTWHPTNFAEERTRFAGVVSQSSEAQAAQGIPPSETERHLAAQLPGTTAAVFADQLARIAPR